MIFKIIITAGICLFSPLILGGGLDNFALAISTTMSPLLNGRQTESSPYMPEGKEDETYKISAIYNNLSQYFAIDLSHYNLIVEGDYYQNIYAGFQQNLIMPGRANFINIKFQREALGNTVLYSKAGHARSQPKSLLKDNQFSLSFNFGLGQQLSNNFSTALEHEYIKKPNKNQTT